MNTKRVDRCPHRFGFIYSLFVHPVFRLPALLVHRPLAVVLMEATNDKLVRHLTLFDLVVIGVAGTIGSGIFAIVGLIGSSCEFVDFILAWLNLT